MISQKDNRCVCMKAKTNFEKLDYYTLLKNFQILRKVHPNLDLVNEPVRSLLFTKSRYLLNRGGVHSKICKKGAGVCLLNRGIY